MHAQKLSTVRMFWPRNSYPALELSINLIRLAFSEQYKGEMATSFSGLSVLYLRSPASTQNWCLQLHASAGLFDAFVVIQCPKLRCTVLAPQIG